MKLLVLFLSLVTISATSAIPLERNSDIQSFISDLILKRMLQLGDNEVNVDARPNQVAENSIESNEDAEAEIKAQESRYMEYFKAQDWPKMVSLYTEDCTVYYPYTPVLYGKQELVENVYVGESTDEREGEDILTFSSVTIIPMPGGKYAIGHGKWTISDNPDVTGLTGEVDQGGFLTVYRKVNGEWLIEVDIISVGPPVSIQAEKRYLIQNLFDNSKRDMHPARKIWRNRK